MRAAFGFALGAVALLSACGRETSRARLHADLARSTPDSFLVAVETTRGRFDVMARRHWAPVGVDRFHELVRRRYYDDVAFFRVVPNFVAQFGIHGDSAVNAAWRVRRIADDSVRASNQRGVIAYARLGPGTRTVQLYINLRDNARLDTLNGFGFPPIAEVIAGMAVVDSLYSYGEAAPRGQGPPQDSIQLKGNAYLRREFPRMDYVRTARILQEWR